MIDLQNTKLDFTQNKVGIKSSRKRRLAAFFIDYFIFVFLLVFILFLSLGTDFLENTASQTIVSAVFAIFSGFFIYTSKDFYHGISPGKWVMGIMVREAEDQNKTPNYSKLFIRNLFLVIWPVEFLFLAVGKDKQRLGDVVAKTIVLKNPNKSGKIVRVLGLLGSLTLLFTSIFIFIVSSLKSSEAYKISIKEIEKNAEIEVLTGGIMGYGLIPTGNVSISNGIGVAKFDIVVQGKLNDITVSTYLTKEKDKNWKLIQLNK